MRIGRGRGALPGAAAWLGLEQPHNGRPIRIKPPGDQRVSGCESTVPREDGELVDWRDAASRCARLRRVRGHRRARSSGRPGSRRRAPHRPCARAGRACRERDRQSGGDRQDVTPGMFGVDARGRARADHPDDDARPERARAAGRPARRLGARRPHASRPGGRPAEGWPVRGDREAGVATSTHSASPGS